MFAFAGLLPAVSGFSLATLVNETCVVATSVWCVGASALIPNCLKIPVKMFSASCVLHLTVVQQILNVLSLVLCVSVCTLNVILMMLIHFSNSLILLAMSSTASFSFAFKVFSSSVKETKACSVMSLNNCN